MIALPQSLLRQTLPTLGSIDDRGSFEGDVKVATFDGQFKAGVFVFNEVENIAANAAC